MVATDIYQRWSFWRVLLSYCVSVTGSYCTIQLMDRWRHVRSIAQKRIMLALSSLALGGCGIWCTHFTGMTALDLQTLEGLTLAIDFELGFTIFSFVVAVVGVFIGLNIASSDPYYLEMETERRNRMLAADLKHIRVADIMNVAPREMKFVALFSRLWLIIVGGAFAAIGVLTMHYTGMVAQRTDATMAFNTRWVILSVCIALLATTAAFWIIFRALVFMPHNELLRLGSALIMGGAVCATHYCGMTAASYTYSETAMNSTAILVNGAHAASAASHVSLLSCYWLTIYSVARNIQKSSVELARNQSPRFLNIPRASAEVIREATEAASSKV